MFEKNIYRRRARGPGCFEWRGPRPPAPPRPARPGRTPPAPTPPAPVAAPGTPDPARGDSSRTTPAGAVTKWTLDWANVREGRALGTAVVHVLPPGVAVLVGDRQSGWWAGYQ